jgi:hypothetical protein
MVKTVYTTFDGAKFDNIEDAKSHEQYEVEKSPVRVLGEVLRQLKKGEALSTNEADYISFRPKYGSVFVTKAITGFGLLCTIYIEANKMFLADKYKTPNNSLTVRISWYEDGQYSASCELNDEGLQFVQSLELNEDLDIFAKQMQYYLSDEAYEVLKKAYKGEL